MRLIRIIRGKRKNHEEKLPALPAELAPQTRELPAQDQD
jgi:hypothetical protein